MRQYLMTLVNLDANAIVKTEIKSEEDLLGSDYEFLTKELRENQTCTECGYKATHMSDYYYKMVIMRVA